VQNALWIPSQDNVDGLFVIPFFLFDSYRTKLFVDLLGESVIKRQETKVKPYNV